MRLMHASCACLPCSCLVDERYTKRVYIRTSSRVTLYRCVNSRAYLTGLSFARHPREKQAFSTYLSEFRKLAGQHGGELAVYTHYYEWRIEIIVQNGMATKAFGIKSMIRFLKDVYGFRRVILFAHGNSSNDLPMIQLAKSMKSEDRRKLGQSSWVGGVSDIASHILRDVDTLQQGVVGLGRYVKNIIW
jgi:hypothetical protein